MLRILDFLEWAARNQTLVSFIEQDILTWIFVSLGFGFLVLLQELRLPLKYYWNLPWYLLTSFLENIRVLPKSPVWGYCLDREDKHIIPVAAVELIDPETKKPIKITYSNRLGQYGFKPPAGKYYLRAVKNYYLTPSVLDPENIQLVEVRESYALPVKISEEPSAAPQINLELQPVEKFDPKDTKSLVRHLLRNFIFALGNGFLGLAITLSLIAWAITKVAQFGLLLTVSIVLLFIKIYILETVSRITSP